MHARRTDVGDDRLQVMMLHMLEHTYAPRAHIRTMKSLSRSFDNRRELAIAALHHTQVTVTQQTGHNKFQAFDMQHCLLAFTIRPVVLANASMLAHSLM